MTYRDPGDEPRGSRKRTTRDSAPAYYCMGCPATFADAQTSNAHHEATGHHQHWRKERAYKATPVAAKERVLAQHEEGHEDRLGYLRTRLKELYAQRDREKKIAAAFGQRDPHGPYVTADDAAKLLEEASNLGYVDDAERRNWFGALFREKGWRWVEPKLVPTLRAELNGRMQRTWAWIPERTER